VAVSADDRVAITDLINQHGHYTDRGDFDGWVARFTKDVTYDYSDLPSSAVQPIAHLVTNVVLEELADGVVRALSKGLGVRADGSAGSVTYEDVIERTTAGWRLRERRVTGTSPR
jgi:2',3'-cyclic-nucleotide 2'-phosphodiesterase (5'-nucleotidase family)